MKKLVASRITTGIYNYTRLAIVPSLMGVLLGSLASPTPSGKKYWTGETNIVATVAGYEREAVLQTGETVITYTDKVDDMCTNYMAVLFYVLSPHPCRGKVFRLKGVSNDPYFLGPEYKMGTLYYFPYRPDLVNDGVGKNWMSVITKEDLKQNDMNTHWKMTVATIWGEQYFPDRHSAMRRISEIEKKLQPLLMN